MLPFICLIQFLFWRNCNFFHKVLLCWSRISHNSSVREF